MSLADSVAVDPHKWLYAPIEAGCALVRDAGALPRAFSYHPAYYHLGEHGINFVDYGPQNSRGFRALKVWLALKHVGAEGYRQMIADDMALSRTMADAVQRDPELQFVTQTLSIATFRFVPADLRSRLGEQSVEEYLNRLNEALLDAIQRGGEAFVSNAVVAGRYALARMHRELSHHARRCRGDSRDRRPTGPSARPAYAIPGVWPGVVARKPRAHKTKYQIRPAWPCCRLNRCPRLAGISAVSTPR